MQPITEGALATMVREAAKSYFLSSLTTKALTLELSGHQNKRAKNYDFANRQHNLTGS